MITRTIPSFMLAAVFLFSPSVVLAESDEHDNPDKNDKPLNPSTSAFPSSPDRPSFLFFEDGEDRRFSTDEIFRAQLWVKQACGWNAYQNNERSMTYEERLREYNKVKACINETVSGVSASAASTGNFALVSALEQGLAPLKEEVDEEGEVANSTADFFGLSWGIGFGFSYSESDAIDKASIVNGIVRAESNKKQQPRVVLEFHRFVPWFCNKKKTGKTYGCGPFVAVASKSDDILGGVGMGWMWGFKSKPSDSLGFSIGIGAILDSDVKDLAGGFKDGQPAPEGEETIRFEEESRWSALLFVTRTF